MKIKRIVEIKDTRDYIEEGDRWIALSGTGEERECDRCGRIHEVHATVELEDGAEAVVGTGCMKDDTFEKEMKNGTNRAKKTRRMECELKALYSRQKEAKAILEKVNAMPIPEEISAAPKGEKSQAWTMDGVTVYSHTEVPITVPSTHSQVMISTAGQERYDCLVDSWKVRKAFDMGWSYSDDRTTSKIADLEKKISKRS